MTTPTQAQIEAAITAVRKIGYGPDETRWIVETALTAAAQVGDYGEIVGSCVGTAGPSGDTSEAGGNYSFPIPKTITAAAQVDEFDYVSVKRPAAQVGETPLTPFGEQELKRLQEQVVRDEEHYQAAMAMSEKHRRLWVEECQKNAAQVKDDRHPIVDEDWERGAFNPNYDIAMAVADTIGRCAHHLEGLHYHDAAAAIRTLAPQVGEPQSVIDTQSAANHRLAVERDQLYAALKRIVDNGERGGFAYGVAFAAVNASTQEPKTVATLTPGMLNLIEADRRNTIERCKQVIENREPTSGAYHHLVAALDKLKDR